MAEDLANLYGNEAATKEEANSFGVAVVRPGAPHEEIQNVYTGWAPKYDSGSYHLQYFSPQLVAEELGSYLREKKTARILDCAAGTGLVGLHLSRQGFTNIDALDANAAMLKMAEKKGVYTNMIQALLGPHKLDIPDNTYDALTFVGAFYEGHVKPDCLPDFARIVKPGGFILMGFRELNLVDTPAVQNLEWLLQNMEKCGVWRQLMRKVMPNYYLGDAGVIWCYTPLEKF